MSRAFVVEAVVVVILTGVAETKTLPAQRGRLVNAETPNLPYDHPLLIRDASRIVEQVHIGAGAQPDEVSNLVILLSFYNLDEKSHLDV